LRIPDKPELQDPFYFTLLSYTSIFMQNQEIISSVQSVLQDQNFMQTVFQNIFSYDQAI